MMRSIDLNLETVCGALPGRSRPKVGSPNELYQILSQDLNNWWMFVLEVSIVVLFVLDLVLLVLVGGK
jgi:hypothetical protein